MEFFEYISVLQGFFVQFGGDVVVVYAIGLVFDFLVAMSCIGVTLHCVNKYIEKEK